MLAGELVEHGGDDSLDVVLLVSEIVVERPQRGVDDLQLRRRELHPVSDLARLDQAFGHQGDCGGLRSCRPRRARLARMSAAGPLVGREEAAGRIDTRSPSR